jgi:aspartyl protease family protein
MPLLRHLALLRLRVAPGRVSVLGLALALVLVCGLPLAAYLSVGMAQAQPSLSLAGVLGPKALLVIGGQAPRALAAGESAEGVRVLRVERDQATVSIDGQAQVLRLGHAPVAIGPGITRIGGVGSRVVLTGDSRGHFISAGSINGRPVQFMVDTGASLVAIGKPEADRLGLKTDNAPTVQVNTANGQAQAWLVKLDSIRLGDMELLNIDAAITPAAMPHVLLGNSVLNRLHMTRTADRLVLERKAP